ncbi:MAG: NADH-ubiquinone oxidoreductase-F iron-sulfur binding region domain-containing protein [Sedimentisphaerales bacterium]
MEKPLTKNIKPDGGALSLSEYEKRGGYEGLRKALKMPPKEIQRIVTEANLLGRGGAGFPTGKKWDFVPMGEDVRKPKYLAVNADEMEPGSFKDRVLMEGDPNLVVEGAIISAYAVEAETAYIFIRWGYKLSTERMGKAIAEAYKKGYLGRNIMGSPYSLDMFIHTSAGRYMCGEESSLINALEGRRGVPRPKPPHSVTCGVWGRPTVVDNVETVANVPGIVTNGPEWFRKLSLTEEGGTKIYGASGKVKRPGWWELPMGTTIGEVIEDYAGGMSEGLKLKGLLPGGASTSFLTDKHLDVKMDFASMAKTGSGLGTGTITILDDKTCPVGLVDNLEKFFARSSCGWCTPCREGLPWVSKIMNAMEFGQGQEGDIELLEEHTFLLETGHTFCALAPCAMNPLRSALQYYRDDFRRHISEHRCPWK